MGIRVPNPGEMLQGNARITERLVGKVEDTQPEYLNAETLLALSKVTTYLYDGVRYVVPPVSVPDGIKIAKLMSDLDRLKMKTDEESFVKAEQLFAMGTDLMKQLMFPSFLPSKRGRLTLTGRILWRIFKNPFRRMSEPDFTGALSFLAMCRMRSNDGP